MYTTKIQVTQRSVDGAAYLVVHDRLETPDAFVLDLTVLASTSGED